MGGMETRNVNDFEVLKPGVITVHIAVQIFDNRGRMGSKTHTNSLRVADIIPTTIATVEAQ